MLYEDALTLKKGDKVWTYIKKKKSKPTRVVCEVLRVDVFTSNQLQVVIKRTSVNSAGRKHTATLYRHPGHVDLHSVYDPLTANVFADFLEENNHAEAAELLRREFPIGRVT